MQYQKQLFTQFIIVGTVKRFRPIAWHGNEESLSKETIMFFAWFKFLKKNGWMKTSQV